MESNSSTLSLTRRLAQVCAGASGLLGLIAGVSWTLGIETPPHGLHSVTVPPGPAWLIVFLAAGLFLRARLPKHWATRWLVRLLCALAVGLVAVVEPTLGLPRPDMGGLTGLTAGLFLVSALALWLDLDGAGRHPRFRWLAGLAAGGVLLTAGAAVFGSLAGVPGLADRAESPLALATVILFAIPNLGLLAMLWPESHFVRWLAGVNASSAQGGGAGPDRESLALRLRYLMDNVNDVIMLSDGERRIREVNRRAEELYGYAREEWAQLTLSALRAPECQADFEETRTRQATEHQQVFQTVHCRKDGTRFPVEISSRRIELEGEHLWLGILRDITERQRAEQSLRISEERLRYALESATDGLWDWNLSTGVIYLSPRYAEMLGHQPEELPAGRDHWSRMIHPEDRLRVEKTFEDYFAGRVSAYHCEYRMRTKPGDWVWLLSRGRVVERDERGKPLRIVGTHSDITHRKHAEAALVTSERAYREIFNATSEAIFIHDAAAGGLLLDVNDTMLRMYGYRSKDEVLGRDAEAFCNTEPPYSVSDASRWIQKALQEGEQVFEWEARRRDGERFWVEVSLRAIQLGGHPRVLAVVRDIAERKRSQQAQAESEHRFRSIVENMNDALFIHDFEGRILDVNGNTCQLLGYRREELLGMNLAQVASEEARRELPERLAQLAAAGRLVFESEQQRKDGVLIPVSVSARIISREGRGVVHGFVRDLSGSRNAAAERERLTAILERTPDFVGVADLQGRVSYLNAALRRMTGLSVDEPGTAVMYGDVHPAWVLQGALPEGLAAAQRDGVWIGETALLTATGTELPVSQVILAHRDARGELTHFSTIMRDLSERKRVEQMIRSNEERLRMIVEHSTQLHYAHTPDHMLTYVSQQSRQFFDCEPEEALVHWMDFITAHPANRIGVDRTEAALRTGERQPPYELELVTLKGRKLWVEVHESPVVLKGRPVAIVGSLSDITARKRSEHIVQRLAQLGRELGAATAPGQAAQAVAEAAQDLLGWDACFLKVRTPDLKRAYHTLRWDMVNGERVQFPADAGDEITPIEQQVMERGGQLILREPGSAEMFVPFGDSRRPSASLLYVPLRHQGRYLGVFTIQSYQHYAYDPASLDLLQTLADHAVGALERIRAEQASRENEERYRQLFEAESDAILLVETKTGRVLEANLATLALYGYSHDELLAINSLELSAAPQESQAMIRSAVPGQVVHVPLRMHRKRDGSIFPVEASIRFFNLGDQAVHLSAIRDITDRHRAEQIVERLARLSRELGTATQGDEASRAVAGAAQELLGWDACFLQVRSANAKRGHYTLSMDTVNGERIPVTIADPDSVTLMEQRVMQDGGQLILRESAATDMFVPFGDTRHPSLSLLYVPLRHQGRYLGWFSIQSYRYRAYDPAALELLQTLADHIAGALERIRAEEALRESEARYRLIADNTADVIWMLDLRRNRFTFVSPSVQRLRGFTVDEALQQGLEEVLTPESLQAIRDQYPARRHRLRAGDESARVVTEEVGQRHKDGSVVPTEVVTTLLTSAAGRVTHVLGVARDITGRKRAEKDLTDREHRYRTLFDLSPVGILLEDATGIILEANAATGRIYGYTREELLGRNVRMLVPPGRLAAAEQNLAAILSGQTLAHETNSLAKDGTMRRVELRETAVPLPNGSQGVLVLVQDITDRKQAEEALKTAAREWQSTFDAVSDSVCLMDRDFRIVRYNRATLGLLGISPNQAIIGRPCWEVVHGTSQPIPQCPVTRMWRSKHRESSELALGDRWLHTTVDPLFNDAGEVVGAVHIVSDITDRKRAEQALARSEESLRLALDGAGLGSWDWDIRTGTIAWSGHHDRLFGLPAHQFVGTREAFYQLLHPQDRESSQAVLNQAMQHHMPYEHEYRTVWPDGSVHWIASHGRFHYDAAGQAVRMNGIVMDITARKEAEAALRRSNDRFQLLFNSSPMPAILASLAEGQILDVNDRFLDISGYTREETIGRTSVELGLWTDLSQRERLRAELERTGAVRDFECQMPGRDHSLHDLLLSARLLDLPEGRAQLLMANDITERRRAEAALRESELKFRSIVQSSPLGMHIYALTTDGALVFSGYNLSADRMLRMSHEALLGKPIEEAFPSLSQTEIPQHYREAAQKGIPWQTSLVEYEDQRVKGAFEVFAFQTAPGHVAIMFQEVTERKQTEERQRRLAAENERLLRNLQLQFNAMPVGCIVTLPDLTVMDWNPAATRIFGFAREEMVGQRPFGRIVPPALRKETEEFMAGLLGGNETRVLRNANRTRDKRDIVCEWHNTPLRDESGRVVGVLAMVEEITARLQAEAALRETERRLSTVIANLPGGAAYRCKNDRTWTMEFVTAGVQAVLGVSPEELTSGKVAYNEFVHPEDRQRVWDETQAAVAKQQPFQLEYRVQNRRGEVHWVWEQGSGVFAETGEVRALEGLVMDITPRKRAEAALRELSGRLLAAQDEERRHVARELHDTTAQTIAALCMNLNLLGAQMPSAASAAARLLTETMELGERAAQEIRTMSYLLHPPILEHVGLAGAVREFAAGFSRRSGIQVTVDVSPDLDRLAPEMELALLRIVQEGLGNVHRHSGSATAAIRLQRTDRDIRLEIADAGKGFDPSGLKAGGQGELGVGIAGMHERLRHLGGRLEIESSPQGAVIRGILPLRENLPPAENPPHVEQPA